MAGENDVNLWFEKYRPSSLDECILPKTMMKIFQGYIDKNEMPNLMLTGFQGTGKTTLAKVMVSSLKADSMFIDCSTDNGKAMIETQVVPFASTMSLGNQGAVKIIICDEADGLSAAAQKSFRPIIEKYALTTRFIFTANYPEKIIPALKSRCACFDFSQKKAEKPQMMVAIFKRCKHILDDNGIKYDPKVLKLFISKWHPDFRRILNELQSYATGYGEINEGILSAGTNSDIADQLYPLILAADFKKCKQWVADSIDSPEDVFSALYSRMNDYVKPERQAECIVQLALYQEYSSHVMNQQINTMALLVELMNAVAGD